VSRKHNPHIVLLVYSRYFLTHLKMSKYLKDFFIQPYIVRAHEVISEKQTFCVACVKKTKFSPKISLFVNYFFCTCHEKY
jgi:hypothetical protein